MLWTVTLKCDGHQTVLVHRYDNHPVNGSQLHNKWPVSSNSKSDSNLQHLCLQNGNTLKSLYDVVESDKDIMTYDDEGDGMAELPQADD